MTTEATFDDSDRRAVEVVPVRDGVFFSAPAPLPRGRHTMRREDVQRVQRERILIATTELLAARGYGGFVAGDVARRAGLSLAAMYACFPNREAAIFAGYNVFIGELLDRLAALDLADRPRQDIVEAIIATYLGTLSDDPVVARAYQVEIDALGEPARERRREALTLFAEFLRRLVADASPAGAPEHLSSTAYIGVVYAARQLASDALDATATPDLVALGADLTVWISDLFRAEGDPVAQRSVTPESQD